jgi:hypothetical protein
MNTTAIANHLNVTEAAIIEVQEWARVLWVRVKGLGARFVSKKVVEVKKMNLLIEDGKGYGASIIANGQRYYYNQAQQIAPELGVVASVLGGFYDYQHCQVALDAGGSVVKSSVNNWGETRLESVLVAANDLIAYCQKLQDAGDPHQGMMQTSTGEWVMADDWDAIEDQH